MIISTLVSKTYSRQHSYVKKKEEKMSATVKKYVKQADLKQFVHGRRSTE